MPCSEFIFFEPYVSKKRFIQKYLSYISMENQFFHRNAKFHVPRPEQFLILLIKKTSYNCNSLYSPRQKLYNRRKKSMFTALYSHFEYLKIKCDRLQLKQYGSFFAKTEQQTKKNIFLHQIMSISDKNIIQVTRKARNT